MEDTELQELVKETLEKSGSLAKIRAELRANVFLTLEQNGCFEGDKYRNEKLKNFMHSEDGEIVVEMVKEFLEYFNLTFTASVFDTEILAGKDCKYNGREQLTNKINIPHISKEEPLLLELLNIARSTVCNQKDQKNENASFGNDSWKANISADSLQNPFSPINPFSPPVTAEQSYQHKFDETFSSDDKQMDMTNNLHLIPMLKQEDFKLNNKSDNYFGTDHGKYGTLSSLEDLPPLTVPTSHTDITFTESSKLKLVSEKLKHMLADPSEIHHADISQASSLSDDEKKKFQNRNKSKLFTLMDGPHSADDDSVSEIDEDIISVNDSSNSVGEEIISKELFG